VNTGERNRCGECSAREWKPVDGRDTISKASIPAHVETDLITACIPTDSTAGVNKSDTGGADRNRVH
jgi:hypothetical protein